jgi:spermidine/putrescine transport system substrate-binding protein
MKLSTTKRLERLKDGYLSGGIDRRTFLGLTAAAAASAGLTMRWSRPALAAVNREIRLRALHEEDGHLSGAGHVRG